MLCVVMDDASVVAWLLAGLDMVEDGLFLDCLDGLHWLLAFPPWYNPFVRWRAGIVRTNSLFSNGSVKGGWLRSLIVLTLRGSVSWS